jgi:hypothetical protein
MIVVCENRLEKGKNQAYDERILWLLKEDEGNFYHSKVCSLIFW